jgi:altronate hydrolase
MGAVMKSRTLLTIRLNEADNVVVARAEIVAGVDIPGEAVSCRDSIPAGHKIATSDIAKGQVVRKYNQIIGFATVDITAGDHVHVHNIAMQDFDRDYAFCAEAREIDAVANPATFQGYARPDGRVGTRNYIGVLTSVNCSATVARYISAAVEEDLIAT